MQLYHRRVHGRRTCLDLKMAALRLSIPLLIVLVHLLLPAAEACAGRKKRAITTGRLVSPTCQVCWGPKDFAQCETDQVEGLTWQEVKKCEVCYLTSNLLPRN